MARKSFKTQQNPAMAFISKQEPPASEDSQAEGHETLKATDAPEGYKVNPRFVETKSRRMQLLVQPSLYDAVKARATAEGKSVNEFIHTILEDAVKGG